MHLMNVFSVKVNLLKYRLLDNLKICLFQYVKTNKRSNVQIIFLASEAKQGFSNKDLTVKLDGARPPLKSTINFKTENESVVCPY
jgi:hypothetical protein